jgi:hypothetical protein
MEVPLYLFVNYILVDMTKFGVSCGFTNTRKGKLSKYYNVMLKSVSPQFKIWANLYIIITSCYVLITVCLQHYGEYSGSRD